MKIKYQQKEEVQKVSNRFCGAYGCPLNGAISNAVDGHGKYYCHFHFNCNPSSNDKITFKIKQNENLFNIFNMCLFPHTFFEGDQYQTYDAMAIQAVGSALKNLELSELLVESDLYRTSRKILNVLTERITVKDNSIPVANPSVLNNQWWNKQ